MIAGTVHKTNNYGDLRIVDYAKKNNVTVQFIKTKYSTIATSDNIRKGGVKDLTIPSSCGVGFIGEGNYKPSVNGIKTKAYSIWSAMITRCYSIELHERRPSYIDCTVCDEWHNFQNFACWFDENYINGQHLDKDIKIDGNRVYSPSTCLFVSKTDNSIKAAAKHYKFIGPNGDSVEVYNLAEFSRKNNLNIRDMYRVSSGESEHHQGWSRST